MVSTFATFSDYVVISNGGTPRTPEAEIDLLEGDLAVGVLQFYAPAQLPPVIAHVIEDTDILVLRYPATRFHEVYRLLRDGCRTMVVVPEANIGSLIVSSSPSDPQTRWNARHADTSADLQPRVAAGQPL